MYISLQVYLVFFYFRLAFYVCWCDFCGLICTSCHKYVFAVHPISTMNSSAHSIAQRNQVSLTHKYYPVPIFNPQTLVGLLQISLLDYFLYFTAMHKISSHDQELMTKLRIQEWTDSLIKHLYYCGDHVDFLLILQLGGCVCVDSGIT